MHNLTHTMTCVSDEYATTGKGGEDVVEGKYSYPIMLAVHAHAVKHAETSEIEISVNLDAGVNYFLALRGGGQIAIKSSCNDIVRPLESSSIPPSPSASVPVITRATVLSVIAWVRDMGAERETREELDRLRDTLMALLQYNGGWTSDGGSDRLAALITQLHRQLPGHATSGNLSFTTPKLTTALITNPHKVFTTMVKTTCESDAAGR